ANGGNGTNGSNGANGANGGNGTNGTNGANGANGGNGTNGSNGANGANGGNGTNGTNGANGANGANGGNGENGENGENGDTGRDGRDGRDASGPRQPVNTAYAAPLAVSEDTCMGSSSIGGQGFSFGLSIGTTWTDENCQRLKNSRQLQALGYAGASVALICTDEDVKAAMISAGTPCPSAENRRTSAYVAPAPVIQQMVQVEAPVVEPAVQQYTVSMAPIPDPVRHQRRAKAKRRETLPPK
ncbi:MAG: hypothetical protein SGJ03_00555, partial [Alphaproteobacteria bacterium]|nr:hypothetical protein [Alphaproteobacteria bacterium]